MCKVEWLVTLEGEALAFGGSRIVIGETCMLSIEAAELAVKGGIAKYADQPTVRAQRSVRIVPPPVAAEE